MWNRIKEKLMPTVKMYTERPDTLQQLPEELVTPLALMHIQEIFSYGGAIVTLRKGGTYLSLAVMQSMGESYVLTYLGTAPAYRHKGYATQLLRELLAVTDKSKQISSSVDRRHEGAPYMRLLLEKTGFRQMDTYYAVYVDVKRFTPQWVEKFDVKRDRHAARFEKRGYRCLSFREADPALLEQVRQSHFNEFKNPLNPATLFDIPGYILPDSSFLMEKDGKVKAYSIISSPRKGEVEFDHIAAAEGSRHSGLVYVPMMYSFDFIYRNPEVRQFVYHVFEGNQDCLKLMDKVIQEGTKTETKVDMFLYFGEE